MPRWDTKSKEENGSTLSLIIIQTKQMSLYKPKKKRETQTVRDKTLDHSM